MELFSVFANQSHSDGRGTFIEWFSKDAGELDFMPVQANASKSKKGALRGIHYSLAENGQSKLVTCLSGAILDVVVDIRIGSPTFGQFETMVLSEFDGNSVFIPAGMGHAFLALEDNSVVTYLLSSKYAPEKEFSIDPFDSQISIPWPEVDFEMSVKDRQAISFDEAKKRGLLPNFPGQSI